jgi:hypothetical protein
MIQVRYEGKWKDTEIAAATAAVTLADTAAKLAHKEPDGACRIKWFGTEETPIIAAGTKSMSSVLGDQDRTLTLVDYRGQHMDCQKQEPYMPSDFDTFFGPIKKFLNPNAPPTAPQWKAPKEDKNIYADTHTLRDRPFDAKKTEWLPVGYRILPHEEDQYKREETLKERFLKWEEMITVGHTGSGMRVRMGNLFFATLGDPMKAAHTICHGSHIKLSGHVMWDMEGKPA